MTKTKVKPVKKTKAKKAKTKATAGKLAVRKLDAKVSAKAESKAIQAEATKALAPIAREINVRFEKADKLGHLADDHRLAAAIKLKEAEDLCKASGIKFKAWVEKNVEQKWETARKLLGIGKAPDPAKALEDQRSYNKAKNKEHRAKKKAATRSTESSGDDSEPDGELFGLEGIKAAFGTLKAFEKVDFVTWAANEIGVKILDEFAE